MTDRFAEHPAAILKQCQAIALDRIGAAMANAFAHVPEAFRDAAGRAGDRETRDLMTRAQGEWIELRPQIERGFRDWLQQVVTAAPPSEDDASDFAAARTTWAELSLLGDDDVELDTAAARVAKAIAAEAEADLGTLEARMGLVLEKLGFDDTDNPLAPKAIVGAVEEALGAVQSGLKAKLAIIAAVGEHAGPELVAFYREVNELLRAKDVLPQLKYGSLPPRGPAARSAGGDATGGAIGGAAAVSPAAGPAAGVAMTGHAGGPGAAPGAMPAAGSGGASAGAAHPFVQLQQLMFGAGSTGWTSGGQWSAGGAADIGAAAAGGAAAMPAGAFPIPPGGFGSGAAGGAPMPAGAFPIPAGGFAPGAAWSPAMAALASTGVPTQASFVAPATLDALTRFQRSDLSEASPEVAAAVEVALRQAQENPSAAVLRALDESPFAQQLSPADRITLRTLTAFFESLVTDPGLPRPMAQQIVKLQVPLAKVALLDAGMFTNPAHPVRRLLDTLGALAQGLGPAYRPETTLHLRVGRVIDTLCDEFDQDLADFSRAAEDVQVILTDADRTASPTARIEALRLHDRERLLAARLAAQDAVRRRAALQRLPRAVVRFLATEWMKLLVVSHLTKGPESEAWTGLVETMEALIWSLGEKHDPADRKRLVALVPTLTKRIARGMDVIRTAPEVRERFEAVLMRAHALAMGLATGADTEKTLPGKPPSSLSGAAARSAGHADDALDAGGLSTLSRRAAPDAVAATRVFVRGTDTPGWMPAELAPAPLTWPDEQRMHHELAPIEIPERFPAITLASVLGETDVTLGTVDPAALPAADASLRAGREAPSSVVLGLTAGDWFRIEFGPEAATPETPVPPTREARLAYTTPLRASFLFTDRLGEIVATFAAGELEAAWRAHRVEPLVTAPLTERAYARLIERLKRGENV